MATKSTKVLSAIKEDKPAFTSKQVKELAGQIMDAASELIADYMNDNNIDGSYDDAAEFGSQVMALVAKGRSK